MWFMYRKSHYSNEWKNIQMNECMRFVNVLKSRYSNEWMKVWELWMYWYIVTRINERKKERINKLMQEPQRKMNEKVNE